MNPFKYYSDDENGECEEFRKIDRFRKTTVKELANKFKPELAPKRATNNVCCCEEKLTIALKFYANGCFQRILGQAEGLSQSTVSWIVEEVSKVLAEHCNALTKFSVDDATLDTVSTGFFGFTKSEYERNLKLYLQFISSNMKSTNIYIKYMIFFLEFPNIARIIDGTQIKIKCPWKSPEQYVNRKGKFVIVVCLVVNHRGTITFQSSQWPGSTHNSHVLQESSLQEVLDQKLLHHFYIIGDKGYTCQTNLLTLYPFPDNDMEN